MVTIAVQLGLVLGSGVSGAQPGAADPRGEARRLGYEGIDAYEAGRNADAEAKLSEAYRLLAVPSLGLWSARALERVGKLVEAEQRYREVLALPIETGDAAVQRAAQSDAKREHTALLARIPTLQVALRGAEWEQVSLQLNERPLAAGLGREPLLLDAGEYEVVGRRGRDEARAHAVLALGDHVSVWLDFPASGTSWRPYAYPAWAVGALGLGGFVLAGALARADERALKGDCLGATQDPAMVAPGVCLASEFDARKDDYERAYLLADVGLIAGIAGVAAGTFVFLASPRDPGSAHAQRWSAGWSLAAIGAAGVVSFAALRLKAADLEEQLRRCEPNCSPGSLDAVDTRRLASTVSLGVGAVALGGAAWVLLSGDGDDEVPSPASVAFDVTRGGGSLSVSRRF